MHVDIRDADASRITWPAFQTLIPAVRQADKHSINVRSPCGRTCSGRYSVDVLCYGESDSQNASTGGAIQAAKLKLCGGGLDGLG